MDEFAGEAQVLDDMLFGQTKREAGGIVPERARNKCGLGTEYLSALWSVIGSEEFG